MTPALTAAGGGASPAAPIALAAAGGGASTAAPIALAAAGGGASPAALIALAAAGGLAAPPLIASARVVWPCVVGADDLPAAYGVQALLSDLGGVAGLALARALAAAASPSAALVTCGVLQGAAGHRWEWAAAPTRTAAG